MLKKIALIAPLFILSKLCAQIDFSASNQLRYGSGERSIGSLRNTFVFRENLTDAKLRLPSGFTLGARLLYDNPPEIGKKFIGLSRRFIDYKDDQLEIRLGNSSEVFDKGLAINLFENRGLAYDTWLDGLKAKYTHQTVTASILYGTIHYSDSTSFYRTEEYRVTGAHAEYTLNKIFSFGVSFVRANGEIPLPQFTHKLTAEIGELSFSLNTGTVNWLIDYSHKWSGVQGGESSKGFGVYSALNYNFNGLGLALDYKNYFYDERDPYQRNDGTRPTRALPFQNPPTVLKEHTYVFLSRAIHEIDFNDEVGLQVELFYALDKNTHINLNASAASRHNAFNFNNNFEFDKTIRSDNFIPSFDDTYSPFQEAFLELEHSMSERTTLNIGIAGRSKITYGDFTGEAGTHRLKSTIVPVLFQQTVSRVFSLALQYEYESVFDNFNSDQNTYNNQLIFFTGNFYSTFTVGLRYEFTNNYNEVSGRKNWFTVEGGYRITSAHHVSFSYGKERGGQICSNGVCRYIQPFDGLRINLLSNF